MERISPEQWCAACSAMEPEKDLNSLKFQSYWVRMMNSVLPVPELDEVLGIGACEAFAYVGPAGTGKHTLAQALAGSLVSRGYTFYQMSGSDLNEDMEPRLEQLLRQVSQGNPAVVLCQNLQSCQNPTALGSCLAQMIRLSKKENLPVIYVLVEEKEEDIPAELLRRVVLCRFALPNEEEREAFYRSCMGTRFPLKPGVSFKDLAKATEGMNLQQLYATLRLMLRLLKELAMTFYSDQFEQARDAIVNKEIGVDMAMFEKIVAHVRQPQETVEAPLPIIQRVVAERVLEPPAAVPEKKEVKTEPMPEVKTEALPETRTDRLKNSNSFTDFLKNMKS